MLLLEIFQTYTEADTTDKSAGKLLQIPLKLITVTPESMASLTDRQKKKVSVLANKLRKITMPSIPPIHVQKINRKFVLVGGLVRFLAYHKAGMYSIPAVIDDAILEDRERFIIYINDKPTAYFDNQTEANKQADIIKAKHPRDKIEVKPGMVK